jgi:hypothetical protein
MALNSKYRANNAINSDAKKRRSYVALLFGSGYGCRSVRTA